MVAADADDDAIREIASRSRLLITVDCGVSNYSQIELAKQHHL